MSINLCKLIFILFCHAFPVHSLRTFIRISFTFTLSLFPSFLSTLLSLSIILVECWPHLSILIALLSYNCCFSHWKPLCELSYNFQVNSSLVWSHLIPFYFSLAHHQNTFFRLSVFLIGDVAELWHFYLKSKRFVHLLKKSIFFWLRISFNRVIDFKTYIKGSPLLCRKDMSVFNDYVQDIIVLFWFFNKRNINTSR